MNAVKMNLGIIQFVVKKSLIIRTFPIGFEGFLRLETEFMIHFFEALTHFLAR